MIIFSGPDGGSSGQFFVTAVYQANGLYLAQFVPQIAGSYTVTVSLIGSQILGSPFEAVVYPGEVKSSLCYSSVDAVEITELRAGITYFFTITFVDIYGNIHF